MADIIDSYSETNQNTSYIVGGTYTGLGQSFTASNDGEVTSCKFYLQKNGSPSGTCYAVLYDHTGEYGVSSVPTGSPLATSDGISAASLPTSFGLVEFSFSTPYTVASGSYYCITIEYDDPGSASILVGIDSSSPTHGGNFCYTSGTWYAYDIYDMCFYVYATLIPSSSVSPSESPSESPSLSPSASESPSESPSPGWEGYSRGDYATLPNDDTYLETAYSSQDYLDVDEYDASTVSQTATGEFAIHQFKDYVGDNTACTITWKGQTNQDCSFAPTVLQIYDYTLGEWTTIDSDNDTEANTDFTLTYDVADLSDYKDPDNVIVCRVYQENV